MEIKVFKIKVSDQFLYYVLSYDSYQSIEVMYNHVSFSDVFSNKTEIEVREIDCENEIIQDEDYGFKGTLLDYMKSRNLYSENLNPKLICKIPI